MTRVYNVSPVLAQLRNVLCHQNNTLNKNIVRGVNPFDKLKTLLVRFKIQENPYLYLYLILILGVFEAKYTQVLFCLPVKYVLKCLITTIKSVIGVMYVAISCRAFTLLIKKL